jgi:tetratricopeptide (TPR) repeat protein
MSETPGRLTAASVRDAFARLDMNELAIGGPTLDGDDWAYIEAAAVLSTFDVATLRPIRPVASDELPHIQRLLENCSVVYTDDGEARWRLTEAVRKQALERLGSRETMRAARSVNPGQRDDVLGRTLESQLAGFAIDLEEQSPGDLAAAMAVGDWLSGVVEDVADLEPARMELARVRLLASLVELAGSNFAGREHELRRLRDYVGVRPGGTRRGAVARRVRGALKIHERDPMLIWGIGGIGKSTLLARFILEHGSPEEGEGIPFAYLDFDRASVVADEPASILLEAARQLAVQQPEVGWEQRRAEWATRLRESSSDHTFRGALRVASDLTMSLAEDFAKLLRFSAEDKPFLLALDTFEEVQYRSREFVSQLWLLLDALQRELPNLRTVIAGRAPIEEHGTDELQLGALDNEAARAFLHANEVPDETAKRIVSRFGGNPLTLKLAAEAVRESEGDVEWIESISTRRAFVFSVDEAAIQGVLYRRILNHIHDETVRRLAEPALVLRRVTPEVILRVLGPCAGVEVTSIEDAENLFDEFGREVALVRPAAGGGALEHRSDVRRSMLPLLAAESPERVDAIHRAAAEYYGTRSNDDLEARAEEIYHELARGVPPEDVDRLWVGDVADYLRGSLEELPPRAQAYLASRLGIELGAEAREHAGLDDLRRAVARRMGEQLSYGDAAGALDAFQEVARTDPGPELLLLAARALRMLDRQEEALESLGAALAAGKPISADPHVLKRELELRLEAAEILVETDRLDEALFRLREAQNLASRLGDEAGSREAHELDLIPGAVAATCGVRLREAGRRKDARPFLELAAKSEDAMGAYNLGMLEEEEGAIDGALRWLRAGAEQGDEAARYNLGRLLVETGDLQEGRRWLRLSSDPLARELLAKLT